jgi:predicted DNA-binding WGR domain protein
MSKKTHLEYTDKKSNKFWEIDVTGKSHTVRYGKIGTEGQSKTKEFPSEEEATKDADRQIAAKQKKGYIEKGRHSSEDTQKTDQGGEYSGVLCAKNREELHRALCGHFSYLTDTPGSEKILEMVMSAASSAELINGELIVHFKDRDLTASPPNKKLKYGNYGYLFNAHSSLDFASVTLTYGTGEEYFGDLETDELEDEFGPYYDELKDVSFKKIIILARENSDIWALHPEKKNPFGKPQLIAFVHDEENDDSPYNPGGFFLVKMAHSLNMKVPLRDVPEKMESSVQYSSAEFLKETGDSIDNIKNDIPEIGISIFHTREDNNTAYMYNDEDKKLFVYEINNNRLTKVSEVAVEVEIKNPSCIIDGDYFYITGSLGGDASIIDISDYKNPKHISVEEQSVNTLCVKNGIIYSNRHRFNITYNDTNNSFLTPDDIDMPEIPKGKNLIRHWNEEEAPGNSRCRENPEYLADGIYVQELTAKDPIRKTLKFGQYCMLITTGDSLVAFTDDDTVGFDISDPLEPKFVNSKKKENYPVHPLVFPDKNCIALLERNFALSVTTVDRKITGIQKLLKNYKTTLWDRQGDIIWLLLERNNNFSLAAVQIDAVESKVIVEPIKLKPDKEIRLFEWRWMKVDDNRAHFLLHGSETGEYVSFNLK